MNKLESPKYCGIDVSKSTLVCAAIGDLEEHHRHYHPGQSSDLGIIGEEAVVIRTFPNSWTGIVSMIKWMHSIGVSAAVMESTCSYWCAAYTTLEKEGIEPVLANARQVKNVSVHKTDLKDCVWLAVLLRAGFIVPSYVPAGLIKDLRDASRMRRSIMKDITRLKNRCHRVLDSVLVNLGMSVAFVKRGRAALTQALKGDYEGLTNEQQRAFESVTEVEKLMIIDLLTTIERSDERVKKYDSVLAALVKQLEEDRGDRDVILLATVPGVGLVSAIVVKAEIGTVERFPIPERLSSYAGLAPRVMQSGERRRMGQTVRLSNSHLRTTMYMVAQVCARSGPPRLIEFHQRVREKKGYKVATIALARKLLVIMWRMLKDGVTFKMAYEKGLAERKHKRMRTSLRRLTRLECDYGSERVFSAIQEVLDRREKESLAPGVSLHPELH